MVTLTDRFPAGALDAAIEAGLIRGQTHPALPLTTEILPTRYAGWMPPADHGVLVEIVYPENRIVSDYGGMADLILLGLPEGFTRKEFALVAARHELRGFPFARLDGRDPRPALWQQIKRDAGETLTALPAAHASVPGNGRTFDDE